MPYSNLHPLEYRILQCECDQQNCPFGTLNCGNRAFQTLTKELQRGKLYDNGFEVVWVCFFPHSPLKFTLLLVIMIKFVPYRYFYLQ